MRNIKEAFGHVPFDVRKWPFFYGWAILVFGAIGFIGSAPGQAVGVSTFTDYIIQSLHISRNELTLAYMFGTIASSFILTPAGKFYDKYGVRISAGLSTFGLGLSLVLLCDIEGVSYFFSTKFGNQYHGIFVFIFIFFGFFLLRFFGQGVITLTCRSMIMKWFDRLRGTTNAISITMIELAFASVPLVFDRLIHKYTWQGAWLILAFVVGILITILILLFFRDNPEICGLKPDGNFKFRNTPSKIVFIPRKEFTLKEARQTPIFWAITIALTMYAIYLAGFIFNVVNVFEQAGMSRHQALSVFFPTSVIAIFTIIFFGWLSDRIKLKFLLTFFASGLIISTLGFNFLFDGYTLWMMIFGHGLVTGLFNVIMSVTWPRFYGKIHLGAINGLAISVIVFGSAIGPWIFSQLHTLIGYYTPIGWTFLIFGVVLFVVSFYVNNPQEKIVRENHQEF